MVHNVFIIGSGKKPFYNFQSISNQMNDDFREIRPFVILNQEYYSNLNVLKYFYETCFDQLADDLLQIDTKVSKMQNGNIKLILNKDIDPMITSDEYGKFNVLPFNAQQNP